MPTASDSDSLHPSLDRLQEFSAGKLDEVDSLAIESHLANCEACNLLLANNSTVDVFVDLVQRASVPKPNPSPSPSPAVESEFVPKPDKVASEGWSFGFSKQRKRVQFDGKASKETITIEDYQILGELGRGGMGVVYRARHEKLKREVALKVLLSDVHSSPQERERFLREAEMTARLRHPGIVQIFEADERDGHPFLALELVEGGSLMDYIKGRRQPIRWSSTMMLQLCSAMDFAHQQSVVHRDLKPGNILLCGSNKKPITASNLVDSRRSQEHLWISPIIESTGEHPLAVPLAKITDFGLARRVDSDNRITRTGAMVGTPAYMAPEQALGQTSPSVDIYALGAILYELLIGRPPFLGLDVVSTTLRVLEEDPEPLRKLRPEVPKDLETICLKCLMKSPTARYATVRDLAVDLELFLRGEPILAKPPGLGRRILRWARRHPTLAGTWLCCVLFYGMHLVARFILEQPQHQNPTFQRTISTIFPSWAVLAWLVQRFTDENRARVLPNYLFVVMACLSMAVTFSLDSGPQSAPIPLLFVLIVGSALLISRPFMIWTTTILAIVSYLFLVFFATKFDRKHMVSTETACAYVLCMIMIGTVVHLLLRRTSANQVESQMSSGPEPAPLPFVIKG